MAGIPSGNGSEVIKNAKVTTLSDSWQNLLPVYASNQIITIVSIIWTNQSATDEKITMAQSDDDIGSNIHYFLNEQDLPGGDTFIWNDKFSWEGTKRLRVITATTADVDVYATYILQDWT